MNRFLAILTKLIGLLPKLGFLLCLYFVLILTGRYAAAQSSERGSNRIPQSVEQAIKRSGISKDSISISVTEIPVSTNPKSQSRSILTWRDEVSMNPASTIKLLTTLVALDILGPKYRWRTDLFTDGVIKNGTLKGNIYFLGHGDPKLIPEELSKLTNKLRELGIQNIDGNLIYDRSAYVPQVMDDQTIDGESLRSYNVAPDPLLYSFRTLSFKIDPNKNRDALNITYTPRLARLSIQNNISINSNQCDANKRDISLELTPDPDLVSGNQIKNQSAIQWVATFKGDYSKNCKGIGYNVVKFDPNTFFTLGFTAAWEDAGGSWIKSPRGLSGTVPVYARPLLSGLSRNEAISARNLNTLLITAQRLPISDVFIDSLPLAGAEGTVRHRLVKELRKFLHLKKRPEVRIKTGALNYVRNISGYVFSKSGRIYAVTSFINDPKANRGQEIHDQLLAWLLEDGPDPKEAR